MDYKRAVEVIEESDYLWLRATHEECNALSTAVDVLEKAAQGNELECAGCKYDIHDGRMSPCTICARSHRDFYRQEAIEYELSR